MRARFLALALLPALAGCASFLPDDPDFAVDPQNLQQPDPRGSAGGVLMPPSTWSLTTDNRLFRPGDLLVVSQPAPPASSKAEQGKAEEAAALEEMDRYARDRAEFNARAQKAEETALREGVTVVVHQVLPNGQLQVRGEKRLDSVMGEEVVRLAGFVRAADVDKDNHVALQRVAGAQLSYARSASRQATWLQRFLNRFLASLAPKTS